MATTINTLAPADLPPWITLMQAAAWVATRDLAVVLRASLNPEECARGARALGDMSDWCDDKPGLSGTSIVLWMGILSENVSTDEFADVLERLAIELMRGDVIAFGRRNDEQHGRLGKMKKIKTCEWAEFTLREGYDPGRRVALHTSSNEERVSQTECWELIRVKVDTASLIAKWPPARCIPHPDVETPVTQESVGSAGAASIHPPALRGEHSLGADDPYVGLTLSGGQAAEPATRPSSTPSRSRGRKPHLQNSIIRRMIADYGTCPNMLEDMIEKTLAAKYSASRDTVRKARKEALPEIQKYRQTATNSDKQSANDK